MKVRSCAAGEPNRVGEPKITASAHTMSSAVAAGQVLGGLVVRRPGRVVRERFRVVGFGDVSQADFGARRLRRRGDAFRHRRSMTGGRVVDDRQLRHEVIVGIATMPNCIAAPGSAALAITA